MVAKIIDGRAVAAKIRAGCRERAHKLKEQFGVVPGLAVILVGDDPASATYVRNKVRACADVGVRSVELRYPREVDSAEVTKAILELNADPSIHGILVQLPLPSHFVASKVLRAISVDKDVDGFHLYNVG